MKCELCHNKDAETAIVLEKDGTDEELYVCRECANKERLRRKKKSQRTRKGSGSGPEVTLSVTHIGGDGDAPPPPIIEAIMDAFSGIVSGMGEKSAEAAKKPEAPKFEDFPCSRTEWLYRIGGRLHLEGLFLIGEIEPVMRAFKALKMELVGVSADGIREAGHVYSVRYQGASERAKRVVESLLAQERNARIRLVEEMPRVFGDAICRSLAVLKNCRLLSPGELFDLLSPLRLAAIEKMLDGITLAEIEEMLSGIDLSSGEDRESVQERDRIDAERADEMNGRFEDVMLNEAAEGRLA